MQAVPAQPNERTRTSTSVSRIKQAILDHLAYTQGRTPEYATLNDWYIATALTVRDRLLDRFLRSASAIVERGDKTVNYLSAEYLTGSHLENNLLNLGIGEEMLQATQELGLDLEKLIQQEEEPGLGNGGLGRLAACLMDSLSTLGVPAAGYGIRYEFGIFDQEIHNGWQAEISDKWLRFGNPWEVCRPELAVTVKLGGSTASHTDSAGRYRANWAPGHQVRGVPYDTLIPGYLRESAAMLRLWRSEAVESFNFAAFNTGDYFGAVESKVWSENISKVLYPNDEAESGKQLRLVQQYFFVSCSLQDILRRHLMVNLRLEDLPAHAAIQMNDTHPSIAVAELMRLLLDEHDLDWDAAWKITRGCLSYTNHTLLPEALERWPLPMFQALLPRPLEIIYEINQRFLDDVRRRTNGDDAMASRLSIIDEQGNKYVRMANLATVGAHTVNGVAELHTRLLKSSVLRDFDALDPERIINITNGVTVRRWVRLSNPGLAKILDEVAGEGWERDLSRIRLIENLSRDADFHRRWRRMKHDAKQRLADRLLALTGTAINPDSLVSIMVKRIHEYKRQHLNALHIASLYQRLKQNPGSLRVPRTFVFGGKSAPGYYMAKLMIRFITAVGETVNNDPETRDWLKVVFLPDYNVRAGHYVYPGADLSEQISMAGKEASGTGNMKFALNGALTIGTLDGANVEIRDEVGHENFFLFGLNAEEAQDMKAGGYDPNHYYETDSTLRSVLDAVAAGAYSGGDSNLFRPLVDNLRYSDPFLVLADFRAYADCQERVAQAFGRQDDWTRMSILNTARMSKFSSDRSIREYCERIWKVPVD